MIQLIDSILCGASFLLTFIIFVNTNKINKKANHWFGAFIFCIFLLLLENLILYTNLLQEDDFLFQFISLSSFTITPIFYLSVSYYVEPVKKWRPVDYFHFGFAFLMFLLIVLSYVTDKKAKAGQTQPETSHSILWIFYIVFSFQVMAYFFFAYLKIRKHQRTILLLNSSVENIDLRWLKNIIISVFIIALFWVLDIVFYLSERSVIFDCFSSLIYLFGIFYITFSWLKQKEIFPYDITEKEAIESIITETSASKDQRKKLLSDERLEQLKMELLELLADKKPFLDCDLNLVKLAVSLDISSHLLSYVINRGFDENFYQFINRYRIEEAKKLILDPKMNHLSLLGIGFEVGFSSKTVFNTTFKKITGQTPSAFKKENTAKTGSDL